jgi:CRISPR-associated protein Cas6
MLASRERAFEGIAHMPIVDLTFRLHGLSIPVDHGYSLYAALSRLVPQIHDAKEIGVQPIRGIYGGDGLLHLADFSRFVLRLPDDQIKSYLKLAGKGLDVDGHPMRLGIPNVQALRPATNLRARLVTIKGFMEEMPFLEAAKRQLQNQGIAGEVLIRKRRTLRVKEKQVVGFEVDVASLYGGDSLALQESGLGGRRRMGCGVFVP